MRNIDNRAKAALLGLAAASAVTYVGTEMDAAVETPTTVRQEHDSKTPKFTDYKRVEFAEKVKKALAPKLGLDPKWGLPISFELKDTGFFEKEEPVGRLDYSFPTLWTCRNPVWVYDSVIEPEETDTPEETDVETDEDSAN